DPADDQLHRAGPPVRSQLRAQREDRTVGEDRDKQLVRLRRAQRLSGVPSLGRGVIGATRSDARAGPSFTLDDAPPTTVGGASPFLAGPSRFSPAGPFFGGRCGCPWLLRIARAPSRRRADRVPSGPPGVA